MYASGTPPFLKTLIYPSFFPLVVDIAAVVGNLAISSAFIPDFFEAASITYFSKAANYSFCATSSLFVVNILNVPSDIPAKISPF